MRLIDADALKARVRTDNDDRADRYSWHEIGEMTARVIDSMPTAGCPDGKECEACDCAPIRRGKWMHDGGHHENRWICTACGYKLYFEQTRYCPACGSIMQNWQKDAR